MEAIIKKSIRRYSHFGMLSALLSLTTVGGNAVATSLPQQQAAESHDIIFLRPNTMQTPINCFENMMMDYLAAAMPYEIYAQRWQGAGGVRVQQNGRDLSNVNPCPEFFSNVLLFAPYHSNEGSLEFHLRPDSQLQYSDLLSQFGTSVEMKNDPIRGAQYFTIRRAELKFDGTLIVDFDSLTAQPQDRPYKLTLRRVERLP
ncbi:hypothetical protein [Duganella sp. HH105]|uniref:hypothetical protein n=1 Tax=Duganella sp. HH105 TaxID=1781067 RepID=UPI000893322D|nr:hypothetical protein [Duganella sp. HH105]OEZ54736.1 hypothetical protein DUGA6_56900 [Duganella sp. HH105]